MSRIEAERAVAKSVESRRARLGQPTGQRLAWWAGPRSLVLFVLAAVLLLGGGRRLLLARRAGRAVDRLGEPDVAPGEILAVADHARGGLMELFRLLATAPTTPQREAAGRALAILWKRDQLIAEEEKAIVTRGFAVRWRARRRYPRSIAVPIPISVEFGLPFLDAGDEGVSADDLEWSCRLKGTDRASLETFGPWRPGPGVATFELDPADFPGLGPHKIVLQTRVRPRALTSRWELEPPQVPFSFEFDPVLRIDAILGQQDAARDAAMARSVRLEVDADPDEEPTYATLGDDLSLRNPPRLVVVGPRPADLAHRVEIELEGSPDRLGVGVVIVSSAAGDRTASLVGAGGQILKPTSEVRPGPCRLRAVLTPDPDLGWAAEDVRSLWPGTLTTEWVDARIVRR